MMQDVNKISTVSSVNADSAVVANATSDVTISSGSSPARAQAGEFGGRTLSAEASNASNITSSSSSSASSYDPSDHFAANAIPLQQRRVTVLPPNNETPLINALNMGCRITHKKIIVPFERAEHNTLNLVLAPPEARRIRQCPAEIFPLLKEKEEILADVRRQIATILQGEDDENLLQSLHSEISEHPWKDGTKQKLIDKILEDHFVQVQFLNILCRAPSAHRELIRLMLSASETRAQIAALKLVVAINNCMNDVVVFTEKSEAAKAIVREHRPQTQQ